MAAKGCQGSGACVRGGEGWAGDIFVLRAEFSTKLIYGCFRDSQREKVNYPLVVKSSRTKAS